MRLLAIVHEDDAGPGVFGEVADARDWELCEWRVAATSRCPEAPECFDAVLSLGGAMHAHETAEHAWLADEEAMLARLAAAGRPVLGVCLGAQLLARATGGDSGVLTTPEIGWYEVAVNPAGGADPVLGPLAPGFSALQWHSCGFAPGPGAVTLASSERCVQGCRVAERAWAIQFHAEVTLADFESWVDQHLAHPDVGDAPEDPAALLAGTRERIEAWNELGRGLFGRFLDVAGATRAARDQPVVKTILP
jgi:GMP synthase (glutamine-hydrolysing)